MPPCRHVFLDERQHGGIQAVNISGSMLDDELINCLYKIGPPLRFEPHLCFRSHGRSEEFAGPDRHDQEIVSVRERGPHPDGAIRG